MPPPEYSADWLATQLRASLEALVFFFAGVPEGFLVEPAIPGHGWGATMQLAHLAVYEERLAAPVLESMAKGGDGTDAAPSGSEDWFLSGAQALAEQDPERIIEVLRSARERQLNALDRFSPQTLNRPLTPLWGGMQPAGWVAAKTVQHVWEHGTPIMQTALFAPH